MKMRRSLFSGNWRGLSSFGRGKEIHSSNKQVRILYCVYDLARLSIYGQLKDPPCLPHAVPHGMMKHTEFHRLVVRSLCTRVWTSSALALSCHATICQIVISSSGAQFVDLVRLSPHSTVWTLRNHAAVLCQLHADCLTGPKGGTR